MSLSQTVRDSFERSFGLYRDLVAASDGETLSAKLPGLPSNMVGAQLWCVVGARESYAEAITADAWSGFACSLNEPHDPDRVAEALERSAGAVREALDRIVDFTDTRHRLMIDLLEHEAAHHGQLIRYLYGLKRPIPDSWKRRYALG